MERKDIQRCIELIRYCEDLSGAQIHPFVSRRMSMLAICTGQSLTGMEILAEMVIHYHTNIAYDTLWKDLRFLCQTGALQKQPQHKYTTNKDILI